MGYKLTVDIGCRGSVERCRDAGGSPSLIMIIIEDSTPLIALSRVNRLDLLRDVYGEITVPDAVWEELTRQ